MKIRKGDKVKVIAGKERGKEGEVLRVLPKTERIIVQGLNLRKKHQRARPGPDGRQLAPEIVTFEGAMSVANVLLVCPKCGKPARVGYRRETTGHSTRICRKCKDAIE
jgi:large subunit ribosomal protein L24